MNPTYLPFEKRVPDRRYKRSLKIVHENGEYMRNPYQTTGRRVVLALNPWKFKLENGFPIITERKVGFWRKPIGELLGFIHGVRDANTLAEKWGVSWWRDQWATPEKCADFGLEPYDMGPGSYGGALEYTTPEGGTWNQYKEVLQQLKEKPDVITHKITTWLPHYCIGHSGHQRKVVVAPCHGDVELTVMNGKLTLRMDQRSADMPIGVPSNMIQYAALLIMIAHVTGYKPYMFIHDIHNAQIYEDQTEYVDIMLKRKSLPFPSVYLNEEGLQVTNLFDFRPDHFVLRDYESHPAIPGIPTTT